MFVLNVLNIYIYIYTEYMFVMFVIPFVKKYLYILRWPITYIHVGYYVFLSQVKHSVTKRKMRSGGRTV